MMLQALQGRVADWLTGDGMLESLADMLTNSRQHSKICWPAAQVAAADREVVLDPRSDEFYRKHGNLNFGEVCSHAA